jgi:uncharacterized membrane protein YciS (DUF1049 family)
MTTASNSRRQEDYPHLEILSDGGDNRISKLIAIMVAAGLVIALFFGFLFLRRRHEAQLTAARLDAQTKVRPSPPQAQIFQDEIKLKGSEAVVGGSVRNISNVSLEDLTVEIELKRRNSQDVESRTIAPSPGSLLPGEVSKFSMQISPTEWSGAQVVRLRSGTLKTDVPFKPELGARRPPEKTPAGKVIIEQRPRHKGDEFINTPDTPIRIP